MSFVTIPKGFYFSIVKACDLISRLHDIKRGSSRKTAHLRIVENKKQKNTRVFGLF